MITLETVKKMAELARIELDAEESRALAKDLEQILDYIAVLKEANTEGTREFSVSAVNEFRRDDAHPFDGAPALAAAFPHAEHGFASVKKVIEK
ncbi:MAG: Asp-tRNA(Asn)/Glu-tRNA(Gln) amidotransferase subunit GatC [Candidatus Niyogibacteria bacterium]|nr:Asp-tRNA(Asn)/Glu-tRNA(Gln) amidotransferase subunit GatC [Candidatus Niyogibacteria bacterium]